MIKDEEERSTKYRDTTDVNCLLCKNCNISTGETTEVLLKWLEQTGLAK